MLGCAWVKHLMPFIWFKSFKSCVCGGFEWLGRGSVQFQASSWMLVRLWSVTNTTPETKIDKYCISDCFGLENISVVVDTSVPF